MLIFDRSCDKIFFKDDVGNPAKSAKNFNIRTFAIGVGEADESELKLIATPPFRYTQKGFKIDAD